jgi:hypothetical protein
MKNTYTIFPSGIDSRVYAQDINLENVSVFNEYQSLLSREKYTDASTFLNNSNVDFYGAWMLNLLENRLYAIDKYIASMEKPKLTIYQSEEPITDNGMTWIGDDLR